jgi:hypothetical protein
VSASDDLEREILGEDVRIKPDPRSLKDHFRTWIEPILTVLVAALIGLVVWLVVLVAGVQANQDALQADQDASEIERARGSANTCRLLSALGLDISDPSSRCQDPLVKAEWEQYADESTAAADAARATLIVACRIAASTSVLEIRIPECLNVPTGG